MDSADRYAEDASVAALEEQWNDSGFNSESEDEKADLDLEMALLADKRKAQQDIEAQPILGRTGDSSTSSPVNTEYSVPTRTKFIYLAGYFSINLALTLYNKAILGSFAFPWLLTALHASSASIGCQALMIKGVFTLNKLNRRENMILVAFSFLFTINIAMSNVSLSMVSVPFHQIMRSTCPVFTIILYRILYGRTYGLDTYLSLVPLVVGVGMVTYGDFHFTALGFIVTLCGVILAVIKTIATNRLMTGSLALPALEILYRMSPLAALQSIFYAYLTGELSSFTNVLKSGEFTWLSGLALLGNGVLAFCLNVSSFQTNKLAGALTIAVCANVKQCLTIALGIALFGVKVGVLNGLGMVVALAGAAWYSMVELTKKSVKPAPPPTITVVSPQDDLSK